MSTTETQPKRTTWARSAAVLDALFPEISPYQRELPRRVEILIFVALALLFSLGGLFFRADGQVIGWDWVHFFGQRRVPDFYPPWVVWLVTPLTWSLLIGITLSATGLAALKRSVHPASALLVFFSLPLLWTLFLGQLEGLAVLGLLGLPWLAPLALAKPQVSIFAFAARRRYLIGLLAFLLLTFLIWGFWPGTMLAVESFYAEGRYPQNIGLGWWGLPLTLLTVWLSRGDVDMLMASGVFLVPHLIPYNLLPLAPALARLRPRTAILGVAFSWLPFSANWLGPGGWWLGWLFVLWIWANLAAKRYPDRRASRWLLAWAG